MTVRELRELLSEQAQDAEVKLCVLDGTKGGGDVTIEPSEDWPNAVVIFADAEPLP